MKVDFLMQKHHIKLTYLFDITTTIFDYNLNMKRCKKLPVYVFKLYLTKMGCKRYEDIRYNYELYLIWKA